MTKIIMFFHTSIDINLYPFGPHFTSFTVIFLHELGHCKCDMMHENLVIQRRDYTFYTKCSSKFMLPSCPNVQIN